MNPLIHDLVVNIGGFTAVIVLGVALKAAIEAGRKWVQGNVKNAAALKALNYLSVLADKLVDANVDRVRNLKREGVWTPETANVLRTGLVNDITSIGQSQLQTIKDASANLSQEDFTKIVTAIVEARVEFHRELKGSKPEVVINSTADIPVTISPVVAAPVPEAVTPAVDTSAPEAAAPTEKPLVVLTGEDKR